MRLGLLNCPADSTNWDRPTTIGRFTNIAFPRTTAIIAQTGRRPLLANPNHVLFYNPYQEYQRSPIDPRGYQCVFLAVTDDLLAEVLAWTGAPGKRLPFAEGPNDPRAFLLQGLIVARARSSVPEPLLIEELLYHLVGVAVGAAVEQTGIAPPRRRVRTRRAQAELVANAKLRLTLTAVERISLAELAGSLYTSPFHLARTFRAHTGYTLDGYRNQLRVRYALEELLESSVPLTALAQKLGYYSLSHFSDSFLAVFGFRPSAVRTLAFASGSSEMRRILEAATVTAPVAWAAWGSQVVSASAR
jgi:AraC-like DNA-binding protein